MWNASFLQWYKGTSADENSNLLGNIDAYVVKKWTENIVLSFSEVQSRHMKSIWEIGASAGKRNVTFACVILPRPVCHPSDRVLFWISLTRTMFSSGTWNMFTDIAHGFFFGEFWSSSIAANQSSALLLFLIRTTKKTPFNQVQKPWSPKSKQGLLKASLYSLPNCNPYPVSVAKRGSAIGVELLWPGTLVEAGPLRVVPRAATLWEWAVC